MMTIEKEHGTKHTIETKDLSFAYGKQKVLQGVNFFGEQGSLICILGKNGAGKSTFFKCLLGLFPGYGGSIEIDGRNLQSYSQRELAQRVAYIPQRQMSIFPFSVFEMVLMGTTASLKPLQMPKKEQNATVERALEIMNISHLRDKSFGRLSGGEQQLVLIGRALAQNAGILIMDEPCASLDYGNQIKVMRASKELAEQGYLVIQATHSPEHVFLFADETVVIHDGEIIGRGGAGDIMTEELLERVYGIKVGIHQVWKGRQKICLPDEKEVRSGTTGILQFSKPLGAI